MKNAPRSAVCSLARSIAIASLLLGAATASRGAGLGELRLASGLGQPLSAEIDIVSVNSGETNFSAGLAPSIYQGREHADPALSSIAFKVVQRDGRRLLLVSTRRPVNGPYLQLPVELRFGKDRVTRRYTLFLDPPAPAARVAAASLRASE